MNTEGRYDIAGYFAVYIYVYICVQLQWVRIIVVVWIRVHIAHGINCKSTVGC